MTIYILDGARPLKTVSLECAGSVPSIEEAARKIGLNGYATRHWFWGWSWIPNNPVPHHDAEESLDGVTQR